MGWLVDRWVKRSVLLMSETSIKRVKVKECKGPFTFNPLIHRRLLIQHRHRAQKITTASTEYIARQIVNVPVDT